MAKITTTAKNNYDHLLHHKVTAVDASCQKIVVSAAHSADTRPASLMTMMLHKAPYGVAGPRRPDAVTRSWLEDLNIDILNDWSFMTQLTSWSVQLFHSHCIFLFISVFMSPSLNMVLPRYLNSVTYMWQLGRLLLESFHSDTCTLSLLLTLSFLRCPLFS